MLKKPFSILSLSTASLLAAAASLSGCAMVTPVGGVIYADVHGPIAATTHPRGTARGEACATSFFGLVGMGDASISTAAKNGNIAAVSVVEQHTTNIIGYSNFCTVVWGARTAARPAAGAAAPLAPAAAPAPAAPAPATPANP